MPNVQPTPPLRHHQIDGKRGSCALSADFYMDMPLILRHSGVLWRQEVEISPVTMGIPWLDPLRFGIRVGGLVGLSYLRVGDVMPWAGLVVYSEYVFARAGLPDAWTLRIGARFGFSWSPGSE